MSSLDPFESILKSMGVEKFDPLVLSALQEYSKRLAGDLLCDARDYANHRGAADIDASDIKIAVQLSKACKSRVHPAMSFVEEVGREINRTPLAPLIDEKQYAVRYPQVRDPFVEGPDPVTGLLQRTYTLVPASGTTGNAAPPLVAVTAIGSSESGTGNTKAFQQVTMSLVNPAELAQAQAPPVAGEFK